MSQLFESIRIEDGKIHNQELHQDRVDQAFSKLFKRQEPLNLDSILGDVSLGEGLFKCRVSYTGTYSSVQIQPYVRKPPESLQIVVDDQIEYDLKYEDRRRDLITDTSYGNICLEKKGQWYTPAHPLLKGTQRARIIRDKRVIEKNIYLDDLFGYNEFMVINAMLPFDPIRALPIEQIYK